LTLLAPAHGWISPGQSHRIAPTCGSLRLVRATCPVHRVLFFLSVQDTSSFPHCQEQLARGKSFANLKIHPSWPMTSGHCLSTNRHFCVTIRTDNKS